MRSLTPSGSGHARLIIPGGDELKTVAGMTEDLLAAGVDVHLNVSNHSEGSAHVTIGRFLEPLERRSGEKLV